LLGIQGAGGAARWDGLRRPGWCRRKKGTHLQDLELQGRVPIEVVAGQVEGEAFGLEIRLVGALRDDLGAELRRGLFVREAETDGMVARTFVLPLRGVASWRVTHTK